MPRDQVPWGMALYCWLLSVGGLALIAIYGAVKMIGSLL